MIVGGLSKAVAAASAERGGEGSAVDAAPRKRMSERLGAGASVEGGSGRAPARVRAMLPFAGSGRGTGELPREARQAPAWAYGDLAADQWN